jgi:hypothetical protein
MQNTGFGGAAASPRAFRRAVAAAGSRSGARPFVVEILPGGAAVD